MDEAQTRISILPVEPVLGLRILAHPDLTRVGASCAPFAGELSRLTPAFTDGPLATLHVSRTPVSIVARGDDIAVRATVHARATLEGEPLEGERVLSAETIQAGVVLTLGRAVALWLGRFEPGPTPQLSGVIGVSPAMAALKRRLAQLATETTPVLLLGAAGVGKHAAAKALHALGPRSARPLTGEVEDDTPYIEEVCALDATQRAVLLARLQRGRVIAGCTHGGPWREPFGEVLQLPALDERPEDIAPLFVHFLAQALEGARERLRDEGAPLLPASLAAALTRASWRGNARQLRAFADEFARNPSLDLRDWLARLPTRRRPRS